MPASIGVNLRVTGHCRQGGRKYMEDFFSVAYQQTEDEKDLEYAFFGIYDGHGGAEAAAFAKEHLMETIIKHKNFWSDNDEDVLRAIKDGYIATHYAMWKEQEKWPKTASGLPSTAGTTASVAFIRRGKIYIGHVGDSGIILGYKEPGSPGWKAKPLTRDHKPENVEEMTRIEQCGGKVVAKSGVPRVVWNRPKIGHQGPVRRSTPIDEIPFLAVARSLGDLWSYNSQINEFIVSPDPDCSVITIDTNVHRCLIFGTDGLFNMLSPQMAVHIVHSAELHNEHAALSDSYKTWWNPSKLLVERALDRWHTTKMRADNTSVVTLMLDPPGPPRAQVLKERKKNAFPDRGLKIMTRFEDSNQENNNCSNCFRDADSNEATASSSNGGSSAYEMSGDYILNSGQNSERLSNNNNATTNIEDGRTNLMDDINTPVTSSDVNNPHKSSTTNTNNNCQALKERNSFVVKPRQSTSYDVREPEDKNHYCKDNNNSRKDEDSTIQIHEISSSSNDVDGACFGAEDDEDGVSGSEKHNLRSGSGCKRSSPRDKNKKNVVVGKSKRKLEQKVEVEDGSFKKQRKSSRLDGNQKRENEGKEVVESGKKNKETVDVAKRKVVPAAAEKNVPVSTSLERRRSKLRTAQPLKLGLAQKILKSKKIDLKKKCIIKKPLAKKNVKLAVAELVKKVLPHHHKLQSKKVAKKPSEASVVKTTTPKKVQQKENSVPVTSVNAYFNTRTSSRSSRLTDRSNKENVDGNQIESVKKTPKKNIAPCTSSSSVQKNVIISPKTEKKAEKVQVKDSKKVQDKGTRQQEETMTKKGGKIKVSAVTTTSRSGGTRSSMMVSKAPKEAEKTKNRDPISCSSKTKSSLSSPKAKAKTTLRASKKEVRPNTVKTVSLKKKNKQERLQRTRQISLRKKITKSHRPHRS